MPSVRFSNSGGPPRTRSAAIVSPPELLLEPELPELLPDSPHAVSAVSSTVAPASARRIPILRVMLVSPGVGRGSGTPRDGDPGGGRRPGAGGVSPGRPPRAPAPGPRRGGVRGHLLGDRGGAAVGAGRSPGEPAGDAGGDRVALHEGEREVDEQCQRG